MGRAQFSEFGSWLFRRLIPVVSVTLLMCLSLMPLANPMISAWMPMFGLCALFYWVVHRPNLLQIGLTFVLALFFDLVSGTLLGTTVIPALLFYRYVSENERIYRFSSDPMIWVSFIAFSGGAIFLDWFLTAALHWTWVNPLPGLVRWIATVCSYPLVHLILLPIDRLFLGGPDS